MACSIGQRLYFHKEKYGLLDWTAPLPPQGKVWIARLDSAFNSTKKEMDCLIGQPLYLHKKVDMNTDKQEKK